MSIASVLRLLDFFKPFVIETDTCGKRIWVVLMQEKRPIAFVSKALGIKNLDLSVYEKELLVVVMAINKWRRYLIGYYFFIWIDYQASSTFWNRSWLYVCSINGWVDCWEWTTRFSIGRVWKIKQQILYLVGIFQKKGIGWWCLLFNPNGLGMWLIVMRKMRNIKILLFNWS